MMEALPNPGERGDDRCELCGCEVNIISTVKDDLGSFSICAGCAELWTTYLMHRPMPRLHRPVESPTDKSRRP